MWAGSFAVRVGDVAVGVRVDDAALLAALRDAYASQLLDVADPHPYVSVQRNPDDGVGLLYEAGCRVLRTRDPARLANGVAALLAELADTPPSPGCVRVEATAVVIGGVAVLLPSSRRRDVDEARTLLARQGATPLDGRVCDVDPATAELVIEPGLETDRVRDSLSAHGIAESALNGRAVGDRRPEPPPPQGRYQLCAILDSYDDAPAARAARLVEQVSKAEDHSRLEAATELVRQVPRHPLPQPRQPRALLAAIHAAAGSSHARRSRNTTP